MAERIVPFVGSEQLHSASARVRPRPSRSKCASEYNASQLPATSTLDVVSASRESLRCSFSSHHLRNSKVINETARVHCAPSGRIRYNASHDEGPCHSSQCSIATLPLSQRRRRSSVLCSVMQDATSLHHFSARRLTLPSGAIHSINCGRQGENHVRASHAETPLAGSQLSFAASASPSPRLASCPSPCSAATWAAASAAAATASTAARRRAGVRCSVGASGDASVGASGDASVGASGDASAGASGGGREAGAGRARGSEEGLLERVMSGVVNSGGAAVLGAYVAEPVTRMHRLDPRVKQVRC